MIHAERIGVTTYYGGFPVQVARHHGCSFLLRGLRSYQDHQDEMVLARVSYDLEPGVMLVYLMAEPDLAHVSGSLVRQLVGTENWKETVKKYISVPVWEALLTKAKSIRHQALQP